MVRIRSEQRVGSRPYVSLHHDMAGRLRHREVLEVGDYSFIDAHLRIFGGRLQGEKNTF